MTTGIRRGSSWWSTCLRRGKRVAVVALARRLAGVLYVMWRDGAHYCAARVRSRDDARTEVATA